MQSLEELRTRYPEAEAFTFGDSRALCEELLDLVRRGLKTATCGALRDFQEGGEAMPVVGRRDIALDWDGVPTLVIETRTVEIMRYCDVPEAFALAEGESADLEGWRRGHEAYFTRNGGFQPDMPLVCETFAVIEDLQAG